MEKIEKNPSTLTTIQTDQKESTSATSSNFSSYIILGWGSNFIQPNCCCFPSLLYGYSLKPSSSSSTSSSSSSSFSIFNYWNSDGPELPLEFSRKCDDGSLGLVLDPENGTKQKVLWTIFSTTSPPSSPPSSSPSKSIIQIFGEALQILDEKSQNTCIEFIDFENLNNNYHSYIFLNNSIMEWWNIKKQNFSNQLISLKNIKGILFSKLTSNFENFSIQRGYSFLKNSILSQSYERRILNSVKY